MSDWEFLNRKRVSSGHFASTNADGFNGLFQFDCCGKAIRCIASDGEGWRHVSVSQIATDKVPNWDVMCAVKDLFWNDNDWVVQFHPAKSEYVNNHPGCLHLWQPLAASFPKPDSLLVGIKGVKKVTPLMAMAAFAAMSQPR